MLIRLIAAAALSAWISYHCGYMNGAETEMYASNMRLQNCNALVTRNYK